MTPHDRAYWQSVACGIFVAVLLALAAIGWLAPQDKEPVVEMVELPPIEVTEPEVHHFCAGGVCGYTDLGPVVGLPLTDSMPDVLPGRGR